MRDNLAQQVELAIRRRAVKLPNARPPATMEADEHIAFAKVRHLSAWIAGGQLSSPRLTEIYLRRIHLSAAELRYLTLMLSSWPRLVGRMPHSLPVIGLARYAAFLRGKGCAHYRAGQ